MTTKTLLLPCIAAIFLLSACSYGVRDLGTAKLEDGSTMQYLQVKTLGNSGPDITVIEGFKTSPGLPSEKATSYSGTAPGMAEIIAGGLSGSLPLAGGMVGAAAVLRPAKTNISQGQQQSDSANAAGGAGGQGGQGGKGGVGGKGGNSTAFGGHGGSATATGGNATATGGNASSSSRADSTSNATGGQAVMKDFSVNASAAVKDFSVPNHGGIDPHVSKSYK